MNKRRLLKLADLLEADARTKNGIRFDYWNFGEVSNPKKPLSCGTEACALGLAALSGEFKDGGLDYELDEYGFIKFLMKGRRLGPFAAAAKVFGITYNQAGTLFSPQVRDKVKGAEAERDVAKKI